VDFLNYYILNIIQSFKVNIFSLKMGKRRKAQKKGEKLREAKIDK